MKGTLSFGLAIISLVIFPWLAVSVASNLEVFSPTSPASVNPVCITDCPSSQNILPGGGEAGGYSLDLYLFGMVVLFLVISYYAWRHDVRGRSDSLWGLPMTLAAAGAVYLFIVVFSSMRNLPYPGLGIGTPLESALAYVPIVLVLVASATGFLWASQRLRRTAVTASAHEDERTEAARVLLGAIASLRSGTDPRSVIISCYRSLTEVLQRSGVANSPTMTAREFEESSHLLLSVRHDTVHRLTALFEKARYSANVVMEDEASAAEATLSELRLELEGTSGSK